MIYLDNSATTPIRKEVCEAMLPYLTTEYGNPSSKYYSQAVNAKKAVEEARHNVAKLIGAKDEEIIFTSGATESSNMIIKGVADYQKYYTKRGNHIITSSVEHKATLNTCKFLNGEIYSNSDATFSLGGSSLKVDRGYEVTFLDVTTECEITPYSLEEAIKKETSIASIIWGNNEIGTLSDIKSMAKICRNKGVFFHTDITQVLGKIEVNVRELDVDAMSMSAHKLYGPKGIGALFVKSDDYGLPPFSAFLHGGEQEGGMRGSTLAVHDIVGFGKAAELALKEKNTIAEKYKTLDSEILKKIRKSSSLKVLGSKDNRLPGIYSILVNDKDFNNERFIKKVSNDFAVSTGSACSAGLPSHVLQAMGLGEFTSKVIRVSVSYDAIINDVLNLIELLEQT